MNAAAFYTFSFAHAVVEDWQIYPYLQIVRVSINLKDKFEIVRVSVNLHIYPHQIVKLLEDLKKYSNK